MPVTSITMPRYSARSPGGTDFAPAAGHDADRGGADRNGRTGWMAHAVGRAEGPEDTWLPGRGGRVRHARGPAVDNRAVFVVPAAAPGRASWSTTHLTGLPARVSWTGSHTALASVFDATLLIDAAQTRELAR